MNFLNKKVIVVNPLNSWWSFQLTLEMALRYKEADWDVHWFNAAQWDKRKYHMNKNDYINPYLFKYPNKIIEKVLLRKEINVHSGYIKSIHVKNELKLPRNINELKEIYIDDSPIGLIIFSAIASKLKHTAFEISEVKKEILYYLAYTTELQVKFRKLFYELSPDKVISINDRLPGSSLCVSVAKRNNVSTKIYYWGSDYKKIVEYKNSLYDFNEWRDMINNTFSSKKNTYEEEILALQKLKDLETKPSIGSKIFLTNQKVGKSVKKNGKLIVFYAYSEHEFSPLKTPRKDTFKNQYEAFQVLEEICIENNIQLILKHHPAKKARLRFLNSNKNLLHDWENIIIKSTTIQLYPDSDIDTYQLMQDADINVIWSSTVGLESIAREQPLIIVGDAPWLNLDWNIHAWTKDELKNKIINYSVTVNKNWLIPWFRFMQNFGEDFRYVSIDNFNPSIDEIKIIQPRFYVRLFYWFAVKYKFRLNSSS